MSKIKVSEIFGPAGYWKYVLSDKDTLIPSFTERWGVTQGEGKFVGQRSVFLRTFGCNFECRSFGLHHGEQTTEPEDFLKSVNVYKSVADLPAAQFGCDSYYSWHAGYKHLNPMLDLEEIVDQLLKAAGGSFFSGSNAIHLILTGGEPMLGWQKSYPELIRLLRSKDPLWKTALWKKLPITIETNGTQDLKKSTDVHVASYMFHVAEMCNVTWSISPKLKASGHTEDESILPKVVKNYLSVSEDAYFKFVVQDIEDFKYVDSALAKYASNNVYLPVYIMPEGGTYDEFKKHATLDLISEAVKRGYNVTTRLHVMWGGNNIGW